MNHFKPEEKYMRRAIELAKRGSGRVNPNPLVGAVIVRDGEDLGEGWHECYGQLHAERNAIAHAKEAGNQLEGSTIYVTLEPCCHYGKTPPCTEAIIENKIARVVVGSDDPNPKVAGKGFQILREHGIEVYPHFLKEECDAINDVFFHYIQTGRPFVAMKYAMTMDGKIACYTGHSQWVTGEESRAHVQILRNHYKGIMVGIGTVLADDPTLNCRLEGGRNPVRIVCDSKLRIPLDSKLVKTAGEYPLIVACVEGADPEKRIALTEAGAEVIPLPCTRKPESEGGIPPTETGGEVIHSPGIQESDSEERVTPTGAGMNHLPKEAGSRNPSTKRTGSLDLDMLMDELGQRKIDGILLEGGGTLNESALKAGIVQKVYCYIAPKIFGGSEAKSPVEGQGKDRADQAWQFKRESVESFGDDLLITYLRSNVENNHLQT